MKMAFGRKYKEGLRALEITFDDGTTWAGKARKIPEDCPNELLVDLRVSRKNCVAVGRRVLDGRCHQRRTETVCD